MPAIAQHASRPLIPAPAEGESRAHLHGGEREGVCGVYDTKIQCVWELIMQYDAVLQRSLHGYRLQVAPLREGTVYCAEETCAEGRHGSSLAGRS